MSLPRQIHPRIATFVSTAQANKKQHEKQQHQKQQRLQQHQKQQRLQQHQKQQQQQQQQLLQQQQQQQQQQLLQQQQQHKGAVHVTNHKKRGHNLLGLLNCPSSPEYLGHMQIWPSCFNLKQYTHSMPIALSSLHTTCPLMTPNNSELNSAK